MPRQTLIQVRRDSAADWTSANPTLAAGEFGFEEDTNKLKCGDGSTAWNSLAYVSGSGSEISTTIITDTTTAFNGSQKGLNNVYRFNKTTAQTVELDPTDYATDEIVIIERGELGGTLEITAPANVVHCGKRDSENRYFINDRNSLAMAKKLSIGKMEIVGNITGGYSGAATIDSVSGVQPTETVDVLVTGSGFSDNMIVTVESGSLTINSVTVANANQFSMNVTSDGVEDETITLSIDNGDYVEFPDVITLITTDVPSIVLTTTSTSASLTPTLITNSGATLTWTLSGDITPTAYNANSPTIDLSGNVGTVTITITSADDLAGLTVFRISANWGLVTADMTNATALTGLWLQNNPTLTTISGTTELDSVTDLRINSNGLTGTLDLTTSFPSVTSFQYIYQNAWSAVNVTGRTNITYLGLQTCTSLSSITGLSTCSSLATLNVTGSNFSSLPTTGLSALTTLTVSSTTISSLDLSNCTGLTTLTAASGNFTTIDTSPCTGLRSMNFFNNSLNQASVNYLIIDAAARGISSGTRALTYSGGTNATPSLTQDSANDVSDAYTLLTTTQGWTVTGAAPS